MGPGRSLGNLCDFLISLLLFSVTFRYLLSKPTVPLVAGILTRSRGKWVVLGLDKSRGRKDAAFLCGQLSGEQALHALLIL